MSDASWPLQQALYDRLTNDLNVSVYDHIPESAAFPYVQIGDNNTLDDSTKTFNGQEHSVNFHIWSDYKGRKEVKQVASDIYSSLHNKSFSLEGHMLVDCQFENATTIELDADGATYHGVVRYKIVTQSD